jgi:hypothetical protein
MVHSAITILINKPGSGKMVARMIKRIMIVTAAMLTLASCSGPFKSARLSPTSRVLLEPLGSDKGLVLTAEDFGRSHSSNLGIIKGIEAGMVSSVGLMPVGPAVDEAYEYISKHPGLDVGVHLVLARDDMEPKWKPILSPQEVPTLVESDGSFPISVWTMIMKADNKDIENELEAQIKAVISHGIEPTNLSFHKGFFQMHDPKTFDIVVRLAQKYKLPVRRQAAFQDPSIAKAGILSTDRVTYDFSSYRDREKKAKFLSAMEWLNRGTTEFVLHLAVRNGDERDVKSRAVELQVITDPAARECIEKQKIKLIGFGPIRDLQRSRAAASSKGENGK